ncbi:ATP synthase F1 subunit gamma [Thermotoga sp. KOL6]|uniref:ATP synthase F1 subunit gamma n=1 Tax=Thermotoga sp. KOL6 TaxID=126741 RepID=UPI000C762B04|nr:ATP synthase F1 subunit gamma [Thermotoga sp. KOL6]PLV60262.1 ATP synthase F1 subunit gamma [Thermotoga sp. KOL6]
MLQIKRKINATQSLMKITRAMEMVARAKSRKIEAEYQKFKPFYEEVQKLWASVPVESLDSVFFEEGEREIIVVITSDMGLCGAFNSEIIREAERVISESKNPHLILIGLKAINHFKSGNILKMYDRFYEIPDFRNGSTIVEDVLDFMEGKPVKVKVVFSRFKNILVQKPETFDLLPLKREEKKLKEDFEYEPLPERLVPVALHYYLSTTLMDLMFQTKIGEYYARQNAMKNATDNAQEVIRELTLAYNKARQASITQELVEIVTGAEALKEIEK